jgi:hypothetical protein
MSKQSDFVIAAFAKLPDSDKRDVLKQISDYFTSSVVKRKIESNTVSFGPQGAGCPICGR